jgi:hypothetical protein
VQQGQGPGAHLRDAREGDPEVTGDVGERFVTEEIALDHLVEAVGQRADGVVQRAGAFAAQQRTLGGLAGVGEVQRAAVATGLGVDADHDRPVHVQLERVELAAVDAEGVGQLLPGRGPAQAHRQGVGRGVGAARRRADRAAGPVPGPQLVEHGALEAGEGVGGERGPGRRIEPAGHLDQRDVRAGEQVLAVDVPGQRDARGHRVHREGRERQVLGDQGLGGRVQPRGGGPRRIQGASECHASLHRRTRAATAPSTAGNLDSRVTRRVSA